MSDQNKPVTEETAEKLINLLSKEPTGAAAKTFDLAKKPVAKIRSSQILTAIFGFVGKEYPPYRKPWKFFDGKENFPSHTRIDFGQQYHFLICQKS